MSAFVCVGLLATTALASETTTYTYDALGRLVTTSVAGGPSNGLQTSTSFDPADNRTNYTVTGAPLANFAIADANIGEGGTATLTITRSGSIAGVVTVDYATANGSATAHDDYTAASGTLTFGPSETSKTISIASVDDSIYEGAESFGVTLSNASGGASIADGNALVSIADNEVVPQLAIANTSVTEGGAAALTVTRTGATGSTVTVNYATANGSAVAASDFNAASGTLTFSPGETSKTISVATIDDSVYELAESFTVGLSGASGGGAIISGATGTVSLADNDSAPSFAISNASVTEGGTMVMTVTKSGASAMNHSVTYATANGSAVAPGDYGATSATLTFLPGETSKSISVATVDDGVYEGSETFSVQLSGPSGGATISSPTGTGTIGDNDAAPTLSASNVSVTEGGTATVTVTKAGATGLNATVSYATAPGTATTSDYQGTSGTLTFLPGETSKTVQIVTAQNFKFGLSKTFNLSLSAPNGATIAQSGVVTIDNDDAPPSFTAAPVTAQYEGTALQFPVWLMGNASEVPFTVNYSTSSGTATSGTDFTPVSGTLTFNPPSNGEIVTVQTVQDSDVESDETIVFTLFSPNYGSITTAQSTGTIKNEDVPPSTGPVANPDNVGYKPRCSLFTVNPIANDTDPAGRYPLTLVSVATGTGFTRTISGNNVTFDTTGMGVRDVQYVVQNSIGGQATGIISFEMGVGPRCDLSLNASTPPHEPTEAATAETAN